MAERHKEQFHWSMPFDPKTGAPLQHNSAPNYFDLFANHMLNRMAVDKNICTITAGTPGAIGFDPARREAAHGRFIDVGIAEQCAVALASGIAKGGCRPVFGVQASFLQRAYDQLQEDVAINSNPAVFVVFNSSVWGIPDETHLGFFSAPMSATIPGLPILAPTNGDEFTAMLDWAIDQTETPVMIIAPAVAVAKAEKPVATDYSHATYDIERQGADVAIIAAGDFIGIGREAAALMEQQGLNPHAYQPAHHFRRRCRHPQHPARLQTGGHSRGQQHCRRHGTEDSRLPRHCARKSQVSWPPQSLPQPLQGIGSARTAGHHPRGHRRPRRFPLNRPS